MRSSSTFRSAGPGATALLVGLATPCLVTAVLALDADRAVSQYIHDRWEIERGFPGGAVHGIAQTSDGYLWIAADRGLVRFDGVTFRLMQPPAAATEHDTTVLSLQPDGGGGLWVQLRTATVVRYAGEAFHPPPTTMVPNNAEISAMAPATNGSVLMAIFGRGVVASHPGGFETIVPRGAMPNSLVMAIAQTGNGDVWLGTRDSGLLRLHDGTLQSISKGLPDDKINALLAGDGRDVWIGTDNGLAKWNGTEVTRAGLPGPLDHAAVLAMARDRASNVWIGTASGELLRLNGRGVESFDPQDRARRGTVSAVFEDRDGNLWIGTSRGIERLRDGAFTTYSTAQGLPGGCGPVYAGPDRTWFAGLDGGLYFLQGSRAAPVQPAGLGDDVVYSIAGAGDGDVWVGRQRGGLTHVRAKDGAVSAVTFTQRDGLAQNNVFAVLRASDGAVWAGTLSGGVSRLKDGVFSTFTAADGLPSNTVTAILESDDRTIWLATPTGVAARVANGWRRYATADGLPSDEIDTLLEDAAHRVWIGTAAGLGVIHAGQVQKVQLPPQLRTRVLGIAEDRSGWLWIATSDHVLRVNGRRLAEGSLAEGDVREYATVDGLPGNEGVKRHRSVTADPRGRIWLAMNRGLSVVDPSRLDGRSAAAQVHVEDLTADGRAIARGAGMTIPPGHQRVTLSYTGISLAGPERVLFRSRLDGYDREWSQPSAARQVTYTNLDPGPYRFRVIASNADGVWNPSESVMAFTVAPAWWQTLGFRLSVIVFAAALGWGAYRIRVRQMARQLNVRFEERLAERTRIAQELHDTLLQGFLSASMQLHVVADRLPADSPVKPSLGRVLDLMRKVIDEGRSAVRGLRSVTGPSQDLEQAFSGISEELGGARQPDYRVIVEGRARPLNPIIRDEVYRIGHEALVNAFRHADAERVEIELEYGSGALRMLVRDNGRGIDERVLHEGADGHWGLPGMRERAQRIGARFKVWSRPAAGTEIELSVPAHIAFRKEEIREMETKS